MKFVKMILFLLWIILGQVSYPIGAETMKRASIFDGFQSEDEKHFNTTYERLKRLSISRIEDITDMDLKFISGLKGRNLLFPLLSETEFVAFQSETDTISTEFNTLPRTYEIEFRLFVASWLIRRGVNINHQDDNGDTALILAIKNRAKYAVEFLLQYGSNKFIKNKQGESAISLAETVDDKLRALILSTKL